MVSVLSLFATVGVVMAATTIGTNITTGGNIYATSTLYVDGASTFTNTVTMSAANLKVTAGYGLDAAAAGVLNIGTTTATTINIGSLTGITAAGGKITVPAAYGLDVAAAGVLNIGTTTANRVNIGSATAPVVITNASSTLANFGSGTTVSGLLWGTCAVNPQSITAATSSLVSTSCSATGMTSSYKVFVTPPSDGVLSDDNWLVFEGASASSTANFIEISLFNASTTASIDGPSKTWSWMAIK